MLQIRYIAPIGLLFLRSIALQAGAIQPAGFLDFVRLCDNVPNCTIEQQLTSSGQLNYANSFSNSGQTLSVAGTAISQPGVLKAASSYSATGAIPTTFFNQWIAWSSFTDDVTINAGPSLNGTAGNLVVVFSVSGITSTVGFAQVNLGLQDSVGNNPVQFQSQSFTGSSQVTFNSVSFHFGQPFALGLGMGAAEVNGTGAGFLTGSADYSHTGVLTGLLVYDSGMNPVSNAAFTSALGAAYTQQGIAPEPESLLLVACGIGVLIASRRRKSAPNPPFGQSL